MTKYEIHKLLTKAMLPPEAETGEVLLFMVLLHTHDIRLKRGVVVDDVTNKDSSKSLVLPAITRRHAADVVASLWPSNEERGRGEYWHSLFNRTTPYEVVSDVPLEDMTCLTRLKDALLSNPWVDAVTES